MSCAQRTLRAPAQTSRSSSDRSWRCLAGRCCPRARRGTRSGAFASWLWPVSIVSVSRAGLAARQRHDLVGVHPDVRSAAQSLERQSSSGACSGLAPGLADPGVIPGQLERDLRMRQKTEAITDLLGDGDLALAGDLHGNTPTGKCNTSLLGPTTWATENRCSPHLHRNEQRQILLRHVLAFPVSTH